MTTFGTGPFGSGLFGGVTMALPTPTAISPTTRYIPVGVRKYVWVPSIASKGAPTSVEITAGTDLTGEIVADGVSGFTSTAAEVAAPDFGNRFTPNLPGMKTADSSSLRLYASQTSTDARSLLTEDTNGFVVEFPEGISTGGKMTVWPVRIMSNDIESVAADAPATLMVQFSITSYPVKNIAIPTV